ncbi:MAG: hypothetical protein KUG66_02635 [Gammaproteobacteria bacterium]|nr:hypothetical protein [Gammaproteobacteria bacterium]
MPQENYIIAWSVYLISASGLIATAWKISSAFKSPEARRLMVMLVGVFILMPWYVSEGQYHLAPAFLITLLDAITESPEQASRAGVPLVLSLILSVTLTVITNFIVKQFKPTVPNQPS